MTRATDEAVRSFLVTFRLFFMNKEPISFTKLAAVSRERTRLLSAIGDGAPVTGLLEALEAREVGLRAEPDAIAPQGGLTARERHHVRDELKALAAGWWRVLVDDPMNARPIISSLLKGCVRFTPIEPRRWRLDGEGTLIGLFSREVTARGSVPKRSQLEPDSILPATQMAELRKVAGFAA